MEDLVGKMDSMVNGELTHSKNNSESVGANNRRKRTHLSSWLHSDFSLIDSLPQTTKVKEEEPETDKPKLFNSKKRSISEANIGKFAAGESEDSRKAFIEKPEREKDLVMGRKQGLGVVNTFSTMKSVNILDIKKASVQQADAKKKPKKKVGKTEVQNQGGNLTSRIPNKSKSRENSTKWAPERQLQGMFGEKLSMFVSNLKNVKGQNHQLQGSKRDKSKEKNKLNINTNIS